MGTLGKKSIFNFIAFVFLSLNACTSYPDGISSEGSESFLATSQDFSTWQEQFKTELLDMIVVPQTSWDEALEIVPADTLALESAGDIFLSADDLENRYRFFEAVNSFADIDCSLQSDSETIEKIYVERKNPTSESDSFLNLYSCANPQTPVRMYLVNYPTHNDWRLAADGSLLDASLYAILLVPDATLVSENADGDRASPTLIYLHGHGTNLFKAAFDESDYMSGIGYKAALDGLTVLVPNIRAMNPWNSGSSHDDYTNELRAATGRSMLAEAALDVSFAQSFLENGFIDDFLNYEIDTSKSFLSGVSFGGQIAHLAGALDDRFEFVSVHGNYYGFEVINTAHHDCQHLVDLEGVGNIFDISLLMFPRVLHVGMGAGDKFYNGFSITALEELMAAHNELGSQICRGLSDEIMLRDFAHDLPSYRETPDCSVIIDIVKNAGHEFVSDNSLFSDMAENLP